MSLVHLWMKKMNNQSDEVKAAWKHVEYAFTDMYAINKIFRDGKSSPEIINRVYKLLDVGMKRTIKAMDCLAIDAGYTEMTDDLKVSLDIYTDSERSILNSAERFGNDSGLEPDA